MWDGSIERRLLREMRALLIQGFGCRLGYLVWAADGAYLAARDSALSAFWARIETAFEEGIIDSDELIALESACFIDKGDLKSDGSEAWFIGEAAEEITIERVDAVNDRKEALAKLQGIWARPFVYGEFIDEIVVDYARGAEVDAILSLGRKAGFRML